MQSPPIMHLAIGMQIIGKRWQEMELLAISQQLDAVIGGFRVPSSYGTTNCLPQSLQR